MPKKKKNGHSGLTEDSNPADRDLSGSTRSQLSFQNSDEIVRSMHDMFSHLDPDVIYIVLSEADFKVEYAMDALLELSDAAEGKTSSPLLSGFEMAAALLEPCLSHTESSTIRSVHPAASNAEESPQDLAAETHLTEEFDSFIDQELESLAMVHPPPSSITPSVLPQPYEPVPLASGAPPSPLPAQEAFMELDQLVVDSASSNEPNSFSAAKTSGAQRNAPPVNKHSLGGVSLPQETGISVDFSHLTHDSTSAAPRPSAFKAYRRPDEFPQRTLAPVPHSQRLQTFWNICAPDFKPSVEGPAFITPVVQGPNPWMTMPQWMPSRSFSQAPSKPSATVPRSWILSPQSRLKLEGQVLVLLRGAPGSGKTTLASAMLEQNPGGVVLSTDEYFTQDSAYHYEPYLLGEAHAWNHLRAKEAFEKGLSPIIIDNTNLQCWEMRPYVALAQKHSYRVLFREPNTWWKTKPRELEKRTKHGVRKEKIRRMLENQDRYVSVQNIMASQPKPTAVYNVDVCQTDPTEQPPASCPDLLGEPGLGKPGRYLSSSLPDVSSVDCKSSSTSANTDSTENSFVSYGSKENISSQRDVTEQIEAPQIKLVDGADLDLDACMASALEQSMMCAESIGQRTRRIREQSRPEKVDGRTLNCDSVKQASQDGSVDNATDALSVDTEKLEFLGDWPSESLDQRRQRCRKSASQAVKDPSEELPNKKEDPTKSDSPNKTEFQKLLDLLQGETTLDILPLAEDRHLSGLVAQPPLPHCVLDWNSEISIGPENSNSRTPSPIKELGASQDESSKRCMEGADVHSSANRVTDLEQKDNPNSNAYLSPSPGGDVERSSKSSQEKRKVPGRRAGKSCKLALTFMHQSPSSSPQAGPLVTPLQQSELDPSPAVSFTTCPSVFVQTEPRDFALLWRINRRKCSEPESESCTQGKVILEGNPLHFHPKINYETPSEQQAIPYRVCHEKGSQVEENDLTELLFKDHSLDIIRRHFKHVPKETLEDLYEKCYQDIEWTTNLLLDSGEHLSRDDEENDFDCQDVEEYGLVQGSMGELRNCKMMGEPDVDITKGMVIEDGGSDYYENPATRLAISDSEVMQAQRLQLLEHQPEESNQMEHGNEPAEEKKEVKNEVLELDVFEQYLHRELEGEVENDSGMKDLGNITMLLRPDETACTKEELATGRENQKSRQRKNGPINIQSLELKLTTELALQLTELFGPVGISPDEFSPETCSVLMDLNLAKLLHQKWKATIQEKHRQAALSYHLLQESSEHWGESQPGAALSDFLFGTDPSLSIQSAFLEVFPFMDHWNVSRRPVSLRDIMHEEQVLQDSLEKSRESRWDLDKKDGAAVVKEKQLFALFPAIDKHFLRDIFKDHNYSLEQTEQFLHTLMDDEPARTVVASECVPENNGKCRTASKERKQKMEMDSAQFQDMEDPEYEDFRTEATLQRRRQQECFQKAAEAYRQGRKDVAGFYARQGHLHGQKMKEANHRAAVQIFERVNSTLLPQNILDLHGLHVGEALQQLQQVLTLKTSEWQQGLCRPQLSVITGRGNRSQGGVARIRPAVLDYLRSQRYKYSEPKLGLVMVTLHRSDDAILQ